MLLSDGSAFLLSVTVSPSPSQRRQLTINSLVGRLVHKVGFEPSTPGSPMIRAECCTIDIYHIYIYNYMYLVYELFIVNLSSHLRYLVSGHLPRPVVFKSHAKSFHKHTATLDISK